MNDILAYMRAALEPHGIVVSPYVCVPDGYAFCATAQRDEFVTLIMIEARKAGSLPHLAAVARETAANLDSQALADPEDLAPVQEITRTMRAMLDALQA